MMPAAVRVSARLPVLKATSARREEPGELVLVVAGPQVFEHRPRWPVDSRPPCGRCDSSQSRIISPGGRAAQTELLAPVGKDRGLAAEDLGMDLGVGIAHRLHGGGVSNRDRSRRGRGSWPCCPRTRSSAGPRREAGTSPRPRNGTSGSPIREPCPALLSVNRASRSILPACGLAIGFDHDGELDQARGRHDVVGVVMERSAGAEVLRPRRRPSPCGLGSMVRASRQASDEAARVELVRRPQRGQGRTQPEHNPRTRPQRAHWTSLGRSDGGLRRGGG